MNEVKVRFDLEIEEDGFPPISVEILNARLIDETIVELDNTPFFVEGVAIGDTLKCTKAGDNGLFQYDHVVNESGNKSISIIFIDDSCKENVYQKLKGLGCYCEYGEFDGFNMLAVSVDIENDYGEVARYLDLQESSEYLSYAELCL